MMEKSWQVKRIDGEVDGGIKCPHSHSIRHNWYFSFLSFSIYSFLCNALSSIVIDRALKVKFIVCIHKLFKEKRWNHYVLRAQIIYPTNVCQNIYILMIVRMWGTEVSDKTFFCFWEWYFQIRKTFVLSLKYPHAQQLTFPVGSAPEIELLK